MTSRQAKKIALAMCSPLKAHTFDPFQHVAMQLQADYAARTERIILGTLQEIMRNTPGAVITRVQDTFIIETMTPLEAQRIELNLRVTQHGAILQELPCRPMVSPG